MLGPCELNQPKCSTSSVHTHLVRVQHCAVDWQVDLGSGCPSRKWHKLNYYSLFFIWTRPVSIPLKGFNSECQLRIELRIKTELIWLIYVHRCGNHCSMMSSWRTSSLCSAWWTSTLWTSAVFCSLPAPFWRSSSSKYHVWNIHTPLVNELQFHGCLPDGCYPCLIARSHLCSSSCHLDPPKRYGISQLHHIS